MIRGLTFAGAVVLGMSQFDNTAQAIILFGSGDPAYNTAPPTGVLTNSGWQYQGRWGGFLGTPIAPQYFVAAQHIGGAIGQAFVYNDVTNFTTAYWDDTNTDLRIWKIDGAFSSYAPLYSTNNETGKQMVMIGRGTQRGDPVYVTSAQTVYATNIVSLKSLGLSKKEAQQVFPDAKIQGQNLIVITSELVTNTFLKGWTFGEADGVMRWGQNTVFGTGDFLVVPFTGMAGPNEGYLSFGDSSCGCFIQDKSGAWKLAGIGYGIDGPFALSLTDPEFYGAIFDESGMYAGGILMPLAGSPRFSYCYMTRISTRLAWIQSIISQ